MPHVALCTLANLRSVDDATYVLFIGLNPSTADEQRDDPTIRSSVSFARAWGMSALCMADLFACCATDPSDMLVAGDPIGPENSAIDIMRP